MHDVCTTSIAIFQRVQFCADLKPLQKRGFKYGFKPYYKIEERKRRRNIRSLKGEPESKLKKLIIKWFRLQIRIYESVIKTRLNYRQARTYRDQESIDIPAYFGCSDLRENLRQLKSWKKHWKHWKKKRTKTRIKIDWNFRLIFPIWHFTRNLARIRKI